MASEMTERVARAIYEGRNGKGCKAWPSLPNAHREPYLKDAYEALKALREPTEAMLLAAQGERAFFSATKRVRLAMIDAALAEE